MAWWCRPNIGIACLEVTEGRVVLINADRAVSCHRWVSLRTDAGAFTFASALPEMSYAVEAESAPPRCVATWHVTDVITLITSILKNNTKTVLKVC